MSNIVLIVHDIRSCHNVGSLLRTAEGFGVDKVYFTGYTPFPRMENDFRLPHLVSKIDQQITKTALGAEKLQKWEHHPDVFDLIQNLKDSDYSIVALEQSPQSVPLPGFKGARKQAIIIGREVEGIASEVLAKTDVAVEIPMFGSKESFNVVQATAIVLYHCRLIAGNELQ